MVFTNSLSSYYEKFHATGEVKCIDDEIPFEIPQSWCWCRFSGIYRLLTDGTHNTPKYTESGIPFISVKDMSSRKLSFSNTKFISEEEHKILSARCCPEYGDLLISKVGTTGIPLIIDTDKEFSIFVSLALIKFFPNHIDSKFLIHLINSPLVQEQVKRDTRGVGNKNWVLTAISNTLLAIPPLVEQKRIVSKIEAIMPIADKYEKSQEALDRLNTEIYDKLKKSVLQEAIQGKLVPQIESEGTAGELLSTIRKEKENLVKQGKLKKSSLADSLIFKGDDNKYWEKNGVETICIDDEIPFEIPATWIWVRLDGICSYIQRGKSPKYSPIKKYPVIAQKCNQWAGFCIDKAQFIDPNSLSSYSEERLLQDGDLMWNSTGLGTLGRMAIYQSALNPYELAVADSHVTVIRPLKAHVLSQYLYYYFVSDTVQSVIEDKSDGSTKQKELSTTTVKNYLVPIPPYREQQRIVEKVKAVTSIMRG